MGAEEELARLKEGEDLVEHLIRCYKPLVYSTARRLCPEYARDGDLLQCGMIGLWKAAEVWDEERPFSPLARRCIENEMLRHLRYLSRQKRVSARMPRARQEARVDLTRVELESDLERQFAPDNVDGQVARRILAGESLPDAARALGADPRQVRRRLRRKLGWLARK